MIHPPHVAHLVGPTWPTLEECINAGSEVSAGQWGSSIGVYRLPGQTGYSLAWGDGRVLIGWVKLLTYQGIQSGTSPT